MNCSRQAIPLFTPSCSVAQVSGSMHTLLQTKQIFRLTLSLFLNNLSIFFAKSVIYISILAYKQLIPSSSKYAIFIFSLVYDTSRKPKKNFDKAIKKI